MKPMLAERKMPDLSSMRYPLYASPKLDGVRALVINGKIVSRALKPFPNSFSASRFSSKRYSGLDGELILGSPTAPGVFNATSTALRTEGGEPDVKFYCFDDFARPARRYADRLSDLRERASGLPNTYVVDAELVYNELQLLEYEGAMLDEGYEGLILRSPDGPYKYGRSTLKEGWMLKLKRFSDSEAVILEVLPEMENRNEAVRDALGHLKRSSHKANKVAKERLGKFVVKDASLFPDVTFEVPCSAVPHVQREAIWRRREELLGKKLKYKFFDHGGKDRPRHPVFLGFRDEWDL